MQGDGPSWARRHCPWAGVRSLPRAPAVAFSSPAAGRTVAEQRGVGGLGKGLGPESVRGPQSRAGQGGCLPLPVFSSSLTRRRQTAFSGSVGRWERIKMPLRTRWRLCCGSSAPLCTPRNTSSLWLRPHRPPRKELGGRSAWSLPQQPPGWRPWARCGTACSRSFSALLCWERPVCPQTTGHAFAPALRWEASPEHPTGGPAPVASALWGVVPTGAWRVGQSG